MQNKIFYKYNINMKLIKNKYTVIILALISFFLLMGVFKYINYLFKNGYFVECFDSNIALYQDTGSPTTSHTVDLPLTSTYSCKNFCAPATARCAITGEQCMADIDCRGCNPYGPYIKPQSTANVPGENDAGKLTWGVTPTYSTLTTDIGTQAKLFSSNKGELNSKPPQASFGVNTWINAFNGGQKLFDDRYKPAGLKFMPNYDDRYTTTGLFVDQGPLASNAYLNR
jgi:hypothetical protein